jgi:hypothetical protein
VAGSSTTHSGYAAAALGLMRPLFVVIAAVTIAILASATGPAAQSPAPTGTLGDARARLQANDLTGAIAVLESLVQRTPHDPSVWHLLGTAHRRSKDPSRALAAYRKSLELNGNAPQLFYDTAVAHAMTQEFDLALEWLSKARASRQVDMSQMDVDADLGAMRSDPRLARMRPTDEDFANPFIEPVRVLREWRGESANEQFGWIARNIGDVDGDRIADIVTSAPTKAIRGANAGRIYVYSTGTGSLRWSTDGEPGDRLGIGVEGAGDTNGDGVPDVIASAPGGGYARVYSGDDGRVLLTLRAEDRADAFGRHVAGVGDVDRDGSADVIVGAPGNDAGGSNAGRAYVYSGRDGRTLVTLTGERAGDAFGSAVAGHARADSVLLLVGAPSAGPRKTGRIYAFDRHSVESRRPTFVIESDDTGAALGAMFVSIPGDVDGDGLPDTYASDFSNSAKGPSTGRIVVHSGKDGRLLLSLTGETAGEAFGTSPSVAGDVDGDGHADLIVGAWQYSGAAAGGGRAYLYSGKDGALMKTFTCRIPGDTFGFDANELGDVNGDGITDLLITSAWSGVRGFHSGRIFVVSSGIPRQPRHP